MRLHEAFLVPIKASSGTEHQVIAKRRMSPAQIERGEWPWRILGTLDRGT